MLTAVDVVMPGQAGAKSGGVKWGGVNWGWGKTRLLLSDAYINKLGRRLFVGQVAKFFVWLALRTV